MNQYSFRFVNYSVIFIISLIIFSCDNPFNIDTSEVEKCTLEIERYEADLFSDTLSSKRVTELQEKYPLFLGDAPLNDEQLNQLKNYVEDPFLQKLYDETQKDLTDLSFEEVELSRAFEHIKFYFPSFEYPQVYTYISGNQEEAFYQDQTLILAIDRYFGFGHEFYNVAGIPKYMQSKMKKEYITKDAIYAIAKFYIKEPPADAEMLSQMIYYGKLIYFVKSMLPDISDEVLFSQTEYHIKWLNNKKKDLWRYYIENGILFKTDYETYKKFISEAPFTSVLGDDSAPRTGRWLGYHIVYSYMKNNEVSLPQMIQLPSDQQFLNNSRYKP